MNFESIFFDKKCLYTYIYLYNDKLNFVHNELFKKKTDVILSKENAEKTLLRKPKKTVLKSNSSKIFYEKKKLDDNVNDTVYLTK